MLTAKTDNVAATVMKESRGGMVGTSISVFCVMADLFGPSII
jgi:hypothetical protein